MNNLTRMKYIYPIGLEHRNITGYSPFCHLNELEERYRRSSFQLPLVRYEDRLLPMHPATFHDLGLSQSQVFSTVRVIPTASFRTVYHPESNVCWKLPLHRRITRGVRDLDHKQLQRSELAEALLQEEKCPNFRFLPEICHYAKDPDYNYIARLMPDEKVYPLFYVVRSKRFSKQYLWRVLENIIKTWSYWANRGLYLEYHTQNILTDSQGDIIYRDLSDVKSWERSLLRPGCFEELRSPAELASLIFDRTVCEQNLEHFHRYKQFSEAEVEKIKSLIRESLAANQLNLPAYSLDFDPGVAARVPIRKKLTKWRSV